MAGYLLGLHVGFPDGDDGGGDADAGGEEIDEDVDLGEGEGEGAAEDLEEGAYVEGEGYVCLFQWWLLG